MDGDMQENDNRFVAEDVSAQIQQCIEQTLTANTYQQSKIDLWTDQVVESCLGTLAALEKNFKYTVTCVIMQKTGAGLHAASACYWDESTDGSCTVRWENNSMYCTITVFGLAL